MTVAVESCSSCLVIDGLGRRYSAMLSFLHRAQHSCWVAAISALEPRGSGTIREKEAGRWMVSSGHCRTTVLNISQLLWYLQSILQHGWGEGCYSRCLWGGRISFFKAMANGRWTLFLWMIPTPWVFGQHRLDSVFHFKTKKRKIWYWKCWKKVGKDI